jgi:hypothetical protein
MEGRDDRDTQDGSNLRSAPGGPVAPGAPPEAGQAHELFAEARRALRRDDRRQARASVESLLRTLEVHFALEDRVYFPTLCALQPSVEPEIRRLQREHGELREHLTAIAACLEEPAEPSTLVRSFEGLVTLFLDHEAREEAILASVESGLTDGDGGAQRAC